MFRHEVGHVVRAHDFGDHQILVHDPLLNPEVLHLKVPQLSEPMPRRHGNRSARIAVHGAAENDAEVVRKGNETKGLRATLNHGEKLSFA